MDNVQNVNFYNIFKNHRNRRGGSLYKQLPNISYTKFHDTVFDWIKKLEALKFLNYSFLYVCNRFRYPLFKVCLECEMSSGIVNSNICLAADCFADKIYK